jgi:hypothetical protein
MEFTSEITCFACFFILIFRFFIIFRINQRVKEIAPSDDSNKELTSYLERPIGKFMSFFNNPKELSTSIEIVNLMYIANALLIAFFILAIIGGSIFLTCIYKLPN